jgi:predicted enzyme related to lactoylglutathione lyase
MSTVTQHAPGTFCWPELATSDAKAAQAFYGALFGWTFRTSETGMGPYHIAQLAGRDAGALYELPPAMREQGVPPHWGAYVSVTSADEAARLAKANGGQVVMEPFDVMDLGRMAVLQDPQGATFSVWEAKGSIGAGVLNEPGSLAWTQLNARDTGKAKAFYPAVTGWTFRDDAVGSGGMTYTTWLRPGEAAGGMMMMPPAAPAEAPSAWLSYFGVTNVDETAAKAASLGAMIMVPPLDISPTLRFSVLADPQGAMFALMSGSM